MGGEVGEDPRWHSRVKRAWVPVSGNNCVYDGLESPPRGKIHGMDDSGLRKGPIWPPKNQ